MGARTASPTCSLRDAPALGPSGEGPAGRVGTLARAGPEPFDTVLPRRSQLCPRAGAESGARELVGLTAQWMPQERRTRVTQDTMRGAGHGSDAATDVAAEPRPIAEGAVLPGSHAVFVSWTAWDQRLQTSWGVGL
nr:uncharacterized protein LOC107034886 isoform X1 [Vicugna pacos]